MNHIAWQLGHLIGSERHFVDMIQPGACPPLPEDFEAGHSRNASSEDDPAKFYTREKYQALWKAQRDATRKVLESQSDGDLDRKDDRFPPFAPTAGQILALCGTHALMHSGQFVAVRRLLCKPYTM